MKCCLGFVSNSSSSSFILTTPANKKDNNLNVTLTLSIDLSKYITDTITNEQELLEYFKSTYGFIRKPSPNLQKWQNKLYNQYLDIINDNKRVLILRLSDDSSDTLSACLYHKLSPENLLLLLKDQGIGVVEL